MSYPATASYNAAFRLLFEGDSLVADNQDGYVSWPAQLAAMTGFSRVGQLYVNAALSGEKAQDIVGQEAEWPALGFGVHGVFYLLAGHNDLTSGRTDAQIIADLTNIVAMATAKGYPTVLIGIPKSTAFNVSMDNYRQSVNSILSSTGATHVVQVDALFPDPNNVDLFYDGTHFTTPGAGVLATWLHDNLPLSTFGF